MFDNNGDTTVASAIKFHTIKVNVTPRGSIPPAGEVPCDITLQGGSGGKVDRNKIELDAGEGPFCIQFDLDRSLQWDTTGEPIWIWRDECPKWECHDRSQIWVDKPPKNGVLTIMNMNVGAPCELHYRLNFAGDRYCDPIIENGGGNNF